jgi:pimeloyl-ACP methyl ester carboxylesterase
MDIRMLEFLKRQIIYLGGLLLLSGMIAGCNGKTQESGNGIPMEPCQLSAPGSNERLPAECGSLTVYENYAEQSGRKIELHIAMIPAITRTPEPDPFIFITGGPGGASTQDFIAVNSAFSRINQQRDIILMDQRGTGQSHPLKCDESGEGIDLSDEDVLKAEIEKCISQMDADPRFYDTQATVHDLDQMRIAMGYNKLNLYGVSYGTRVAQTYLRTYPEHVRTVILDGIVPQDEALGMSIATDAQKVLDAVFARCAADPKCNHAFPNLPAALEALLERVEREPVLVHLEDPYTSEPTEVKFTRNKLCMAIRLLSYASETAALLPLLIHDASTTGDLSRLAAQSTIVTEQLEGSINSGLGNSVLCAEDVPFLRKNGEFVGDALAEKNSYLGEYYLQMEKLCKYWPAASVSPEFKTPVRSDVPVLLLSGEFDPVTPPDNAHHIERTLSNSLNLVAPGQGHGVILRGCICKIATQFIESGTLDGLDIDCVQILQPAPFFLTYTGPTP